MKNVIYYLLILGTVLTGCNPMEDIYSDIDSQEVEGKDYIKGTLEYTFTEDDYAIYDVELDSEEYFASQEVADEIIPSFLADKYSILGEGSLINVSYNLFQPTIIESMSTTETLSNIGEIDGYLASNFETAANGTFVELTYNADVLAYTLSDGDFETIGNALSDSYPEASASAANYGNFDRRPSNAAYWSDDMILEGFNELLKDEYNVGQVVAVTFAIYDGGSNFTESFTIQYNGYGFLKLDVEASAATGTDYTLSGTDYDDIASALSDSYPGPSNNLSSYGNFDRRPTSSNYWSDSMIIEGLNVVLPAVAEGDIYIVTYDVYNGSNATETMTVMYSGGAYIANTTIVEVETIVAKSNGEWEFPYVFTDADYTLLEQSYGNFDSGSIYKLDIFLESLFPYAKAGDAVTVQYEYYSGGTSTKYGTSVYDGDKWHLTQDVVETTFQYGFENGAWLPDNTIAYTLLSADYEYIAEALEGNPDFSGLLATLVNYHDYDYNWTSEQIVYSLAIFAEHIAPNAEEGQKYLFTYLVYDSGLQTLSTKMILTDGVWVEKVN